MPHHVQASAFGGWHLATAGATLAVVLQLWGLYRVGGPPQPPWFPMADKVEHMIGFALPVVLILLAVALRHPQGWRWPSPVTRPLVIGAFAAHAVVSEVIQHIWYRHRTGDPLDVLADWAGIALGLLLLKMILLHSSRGARGLAAS
jgi:hypothetical protein